MRNYQKIKIETLEALTNRKSTTALSRKLGYSFDQVRRWKNGTKHLRWDEFCDLCEAVKAPLPEIALDLFGLAIRRQRDLYNITGPLRVFSRTRNISQLAKSLGVSLAMMKRYIAGKTYPDIEFVFELIDLREGFLDRFVESLVQPKPVQTNIFSVPWLASVSGAMAHKEHLSLPSYSPAWIARRLKLTERQVDDAVRVMIECGLIEKKPDGHYQPTLSRTLAVANHIEPRNYARTMQFWTKRAGDRYATNTGQPHTFADSADTDRGFFRCFSTDPETARKVTDVLSRAEQEIHDILTTATGDRTELRAMVLHHFDAGAVPPTKNSIGS